MQISEIENLVIDVPDFPKPGVLFKDITPIFENPKAFKALILHFKKCLENRGATHLVAIESRGFIFGAAVAQHLDLGLVLARKPGKLPRETMKVTYDLEYGTDTLEIHKGALSANDKVIIIDDVLATGGTAHAVETICTNMNAEVVTHQFLMEIEVLNGRKRLTAPVESFLKV